MLDEHCYWHYYNTDDVIITLNEVRQSTLVSGQINDCLARLGLQPQPGIVRYPELYHRSCTPASCAFVINVVMSTPSYTYICTLSSCAPAPTSSPNTPLYGVILARIVRHRWRTISAYDSACGAPDMPVPPRWRCVRLSAISPRLWRCHVSPSVGCRSGPWPGAITP